MTTDTHALLHKASYHPRHTFKGIIKSQILRFYRICSRVSDFNDAISILFRSLRSWHYSARFLRNIKRTTLASLPPAPPSIISSPSYNRSRRGIINVTITHAVRIPLPTILHHPVWSRSSPRSPIHRHNSMDFLNRTSHRWKKNTDRFRIIPLFPLSKKKPSLRDTLVKASFSLDSKVRTENQERLYSLKYIINPHSKCGAPIYQSLTLTPPNVVYANTCRQCDLLYVGETSKPLLTRLKQHLARISKGTPQTHLTQHFQVHSINSLNITGLESNPSWTHTQRKRIEGIWTTKLDTLAPRSLNWSLPLVSPNVYISPAPPPFSPPSSQ